jgi:ClpP class serine protease
MALGGHEILMGPGSALGPIDAQILQDGKQFSADALIEGLDRIKKDVEDTKKLNAAYIPILQKISPGEIQNAVNALEFARVTVRDWLVKYKFSNWTVHQSTGAAVTDDEKTKRAYEISTALSSQARWYTHGRSIGIAELRELKLKITDFAEDAHRNYQHIKGLRNC